jgi:hypothetical protein
MNRRKTIVAAVVLFVLFLAGYLAQEGWVLMPDRTHWWWWVLSGAALGFNLGYQFSEWENRKHDRIRSLEAENRELFLAIRQMLIEAGKLELTKLTEK